MNPCEKVSSFPVQVLCPFADRATFSHKVRIPPRMASHAMRGFFISHKAGGSTRAEAKRSHQADDAEVRRLSPQPRSRTLLRAAGDGPDALASRRSGPSPGQNGSSVSLDSRHGSAGIGQRELQSTGSLCLHSPPESTPTGQARYQRRTVLSNSSNKRSAQSRTLAN